ncbi:MAG: 7-cyano-7-deazaguanine synthase [Acidimicrobiales bacterium]
MNAGDGIAVLTSGGVDSAILVGDLVRRGRIVHPIYVRFGLVWEEAEESHLRRFMATLPNPGARPLVTLEQPIADVYGEHWSTSGVDVPDAASADEAVYLPGRNLLLLAKSSIWCALNGVGTIALGTLKGNPFGDATPEFFSAYGSLAHRALSRPLAVVTPFSGMTKAEVLERGRGLALQWTFSCIRPTGDGLHCGRCNKCAERQRAFTALDLQDVTAYAS